MKTIFITGASSGLGKATAKLFSEKGWNVIATMRNPEKEKELVDLKNIHLYALDITDSEKVKARILLSTTTLTVGEIDYRMGFEHPQSFNKFFLKQTELSPIAYRNSFN